MSARNPPFEYPESLQQYMIPESEYYRQNPQHNKLVSGAVVFDSEGKMLLVQRAADEKAFPNCWEIPGGSVDDTDETILHAAAREVMEETGLEVTRFVRTVGEFGWADYHQRRQRHESWRKVIFEVEVRDLAVVLNADEHQAHLFATEEEVRADQAAGCALSWISAPNKEMNLAAFRLRREAREAASAA